MLLIVLMCPVLCGCFGACLSVMFTASICVTCVWIAVGIVVCWANGGYTACEFGLGYGYVSSLRFDFGLICVCWFWFGKLCFCSLCWCFGVGVGVLMPMFVTI